MPRLAIYIFVYDSLRKTFPVRVRVVRWGEDESKIEDLGSLTGTVLADEAEKTFERLLGECAGARYEVSRASASAWNAIASNYVGMKDNDFDDIPCPLVGDCVDLEGENVLCPVRC